MSSIWTQHHSLGRMLFLAFLCVPLEALALLAMILGVASELNQTTFSLFCLMGGVVLTAGLLRINHSFTEISRLHERIEELQSDVDYLTPIVDVWDSQRQLMTVSGQDTPAVPIITKGSCLYGALILEEVGETMKALARSLDFSIKDQESNYPEYAELAQFYWETGRRLIYEAGQIRQNLTGQRGLPVKILDRDLAKELLDGFTDIHVVAAGGSIACGLPGKEAYTETISSNLSKANPDTGLIDKTPDGKWLKGRDYFPPNLDKVLARYYPAPSQDERPGV